MAEQVAPGKCAVGNIISEGRGGPGTMIEVKHGGLYKPADAGERERMKAAGTLVDPLWYAPDHDVGEAKVTLTHRPSNPESDKDVVAAREVQKSVTKQQQAEDAAVARLQEDRDAADAADTVDADGAAVMSNQPLDDVQGRIESELRIAKRRVRAVEALASKADGAVNAALGKARDAARSEAAPTVAALRKQLVKHIVGARDILADIAELYRRLAAVGAPLPENTLKVTTFQADGKRDGLLTAALLEVLHGVAPKLEFPGRDTPIA